MYLVLIAWLYVTLMMAVAEGTSPTGTLLGALMTFVLYGLLPMGILGYILGTPARKRALRARAQEEEAAAAETGAEGVQGSPLPHAPIAPDADGHSARAAETAGITAVRKEP